MEGQPTNPSFFAEQRLKLGFSRYIVAVVSKLSNKCFGTPNQICRELRGGYCMTRVPQDDYQQQFLAASNYCTHRA